MLDVLEVASGWQIGQRASADLELWRHRLALVVEHRLHADPYQYRHANDVQDVVLVALALPMLDVEVCQL
ncbi:hypothetical protein D3C81_1897630 [compost metagenome]